MMCRILSTVSALCAVFATAVSSVPFAEDARPVVNSPVGSIRGLRADNGNYSMFMGIPYAQVDQDNPFGNAKPYPKFKRIFDAFDDSASCPQEKIDNNTIAIVGSLDCLHINVYVPDSASNDNTLSVYVWIHGGGYYGGSAGRYIHGPSFLVRHDIILVTLNYRLGPYGFMCLDIPEVPGNQGLKDQVLALKWVRENIRAFGGDNNKITVGGNSAGAMSADLHLVYGQEDLFHRVILQSGVALLSGTVVGSNPGTPFELAKILNHTANDIKDALSFLAAVDPHQLIAVIRDSQLARSFVPCVEKEFDDIQGFITEFPMNTKVPRVKNVDILIGVVNDELYGSFVNIPDIVFEYMDFVGISLTESFDFENEKELYAEMHEIVTHFYHIDENITADLKRHVIDLGNDFMFIHPALRTVKKYLDNGVKSMYFYLFSYLGGRNLMSSTFNVTGGGASHDDDMGYLFDISFMDKPDVEDQIIVDRNTEMWANFVKYGNPTPELTELTSILWERVTPEKWSYLELNKEPHLSSRRMHDRMAFLDLFYKLNEKYQKGYKREKTENSGSSLGHKLVLNLSLFIMFTLRYILV